MNFRERRLALGLSQREVGDIAGMAQGIVSNVELGRSAAGPAAVARVAAALAKIEAERGARPARDFRLRERRRALRLSDDEMGELAFFRPGFGALVRRAEIGLGRPEEVRAIRRALIWEESAPRRAREELRRQNERIALQRAIFSELRDHPKFQDVVDVMLSRCLELMHDGDGSECDAIAEWLPEDGVGAMFDRWWLEQSADVRCGRCEPIPVDLVSSPPQGGPDGQHRTEGAGPARAA
ncbi:MAG: helix-turn-helix transcriptional regulator [Proteobacteria bacterium]|nr:helix-turn-helix transcriptional regulator [Pseudomonadota bacterium]